MAIAKREIRDTYLRNTEFLNCMNAGAITTKWRIVSPKIISYFSLSGSRMTGILTAKFSKKPQRLKIR